MLGFAVKRWVSLVVLSKLNIAFERSISEILMIKIAFKFSVSVCPSLSLSVSWLGVKHQLTTLCLSLSLSLSVSVVHVRGLLCDITSPGTILYMSKLYLVFVCVCVCVCVRACVRACVCVCACVCRRMKRRMRLLIANMCCTCKTFSRPSHTARCSCARVRLVKIQVNHDFTCGRARILLAGPVLEG